MPLPRSLKILSLSEPVRSAALALAQHELSFLPPFPDPQSTVDVGWGWTSGGATGQRVLLLSARQVSLGPCMAGQGWAVL